MKCAAWGLALLAGVTAAFPAWAGPKVYVPVGSADQVLVIDADTDEITDRIKAVTESHGLAGSADGRYLIAGSLDELDADNTLPVRPEGMAQSEHESHHSGGDAVKAVNVGSISYLSLIRTEDNVIERRIAVPGTVHHTLFTPDGAYAVATHPNEEGVSIVDLRTYDVRTVATGPLPNYAVAAPDGKFVYVSNAGNNTISKIDTARWIVRANIEAGEAPEHMVISADGSSLFVNNTGDGSVAAIALPSGEVLRTFKIGGDIHGIDVSDDGKTLFIAGREENKIAAVDIASGRIESKPLSPSPYHLAAIRGTNKLYVSSAEDDTIWVVDRNTLQAIKDIAVPDRAHQMVVLP